MKDASIMNSTSSGSPGGRTMKSEKEIRQAIAHLEGLRKNYSERYTNQEARNHMAFCSAKIAALEWALGEGGDWL